VPSLRQPFSNPFLRSQSHSLAKICTSNSGSVEVTPYWQDWPSSLASRSRYGSGIRGRTFGGKAHSRAELSAPPSLEVQVLDPFVLESLILHLFQNLLITLDEYVAWRCSRMKTILRKHINLTPLPFAFLGRLSLAHPTCPSRLRYVPVQATSGPLHQLQSDKCLKFSM
jgi:hypothetical protein